MSGHTLSLIVFAAIVSATLVVTLLVARKANTADQFWAAGGEVGATRNALAIAGDFLSASAFLGTTGLIFLVGFDGLVYLIVPLAAWIPLVLIYAQRLRRLGRYTLTDVLTSRFNAPALRIALAVTTLTISGLYLLAQLVAAGSIFELLSGMPFELAVLLTAALMVLYVAVGGMLATTWVQAIKAVLLLSVLALLTVLMFVRIGGDWSGFVDGAMAPTGLDPLQPGNLFGSGWNTLSAGLALALGVVGLPHIVMRLFTVKDARAAQQSATRTVAIIGCATILIIFVGMGARYLLKDQTAAIAATAGNLTMPLLGEKLGGGPDTFTGTFMLALVSAVAFATILAVVAGLLINASSAIVRDLLPRRLTAPETASPGAEVRLGRMAAVGVAVLIAFVAIQFGAGLNASVMVTLAFGVAASANFPVLTLSLFWRGFNAFGALCGVCAGLISSVVLLALGPTLWLGSGESPLSLSDPTIIAMPLGFLGCIAGSLLAPRSGQVRDSTAAHRSAPSTVGGVDA